MKKLTLIPIGGLANRFYAITSAIAFCKDYNIKLKVIWFKDKGMGADFHSLFELSEDVDKSIVEIVDAKWYHYIYDRPRKRNLWLPWLWQRLIFDQILNEKYAYRSKSFFKTVLNNSTNSYFVCFFQFYLKFDVLKSIHPNHKVCEMIESRMLLLGENIIGIHIRRTDNILSIEKSPLTLFIDKIYYEISRNPSIKFYIASDSVDEKNKIKSIFGDKIFYSDIAARRDTFEGIINAVVELYILSKTKKIYGSYASTFSTLAANISGINIDILSI